MFNIADNKIIQTKTIHYTDENNNSVFFRKDAEGSTVKLRFINKDIKVHPIYIKYQDGEENPGATLVFDTDPATLDLETRKAVSCVIDDFKNLLQRLYEITALLDNIHSAIGYASRANVASDEFKLHLLNVLTSYEETRPLADLFR